VTVESFHVRYDVRDHWRSHLQACETCSEPVDEVATFCPAGLEIRDTWLRVVTIDTVRRVHELMERDESQSLAETVVGAAEVWRL
jgi:hypothetical protein